MPFNDPFFLFVFLPLVLGAYFAVGRRWRNAVALTGSLFFYAWGEPCFVLLVIASGFLDWWLTGRMHRGRLGRRLAVGLAVASNLGILVVFKYLDFLLHSLLAVTGAGAWTDAPPLGLALPFGISFVIFQKITYVVDVARGDGPPASRFRDYLLYIHLFPQLIAGPIVQYHDVAAQIHRRAHGWGPLRAGIPRFALGLAKKVLLADACAFWAEAAFGAEAGSLGAPLAWIGMVAYTLQIYLDFSAYSDMAIGLARIMGFRLKENFDRPYRARSFTEFWRRWHISLSTFIRSYLYLPLGGNRRGGARTVLNLWICFLASGLWHGAAWTFLLWGAWHGLILTLERFWLLRLYRHLPRLIPPAITLVLVMVGWVFFASPDAASAGAYLYALLPHGRNLTLPVIPPLATAATVAAALLVGVSLFGPGRWPGRRLPPHSRRTLALTGAIILLLISSVRLVSASSSPFLYFRF